MRSPILIVTALALTLFKPSDVKGAPANSLRELYAAFDKCVQVPTAVAGSEITVVFSIKRDGSLLGKPRISHAKLLGNASDEKNFVADVLRASAKCFPISITTGLGSAVAGRLLPFRIISRAHEINT
jgi:hypothetical protein